MSGKIMDKVKYFIGLDVFEEEEEQDEEEVQIEQDDLYPVVNNKKK